MLSGETKETFFKTSKSAKVCSRYLRKEDLKKTLAGKICLKPGAVSCKGKQLTERYTCESVASASAASSSSTSNTFPGVSKFEIENQMEITVAFTCSGVEMEAVNSEMESYERDLAEAITGQNKRI